MKKGGAGVVKKAIWMKTHEVAVKTLNIHPEFAIEEDMASFYKEIKQRALDEDTTITQLIIKALNEYMSK